MVIVLGEMRGRTHGGDGRVNEPRPCFCATNVVCIINVLYALSMCGRRLESRPNCERSPLLEAKAPVCEQGPTSSVALGQNYIFQRPRALERAGARTENLCLPFPQDCVLFYYAV